MCYNYRENRLCIGRITNMIKIEEIIEGTLYE